MKKFLQKISDTLREQKLLYLLVLLFFCIGVVIGVYTVMYMEETDRNDLTSYFNSYITGFGVNSADYGKLLITVLKKNILLIVPIVLLSFTFFGSPFILIIDFIKGFSLGYTFTFILCTFNGRGLGLAAISIIPQNIIYIPCLIILSVIGLYLSSTIFKEKFFKHQIISKLEILKSSKNLFIIVLGLFLLGVLIETYVSPNIIKFVVNKFYN